MEKSLCRQCSLVTLPSLLSIQGHFHHESLVSLQTAAIECMFCNIILSHLVEAALKGKLYGSVPKKPERSCLLQTPKNWHTLLENYATPVSLHYSSNYSPGTKPREINRDPTSDSFLDVTCGITSATAAEKVRATLKDTVPGLGIDGCVGWFLCVNRSAYLCLRRFVNLD